MDNGHAGLSGGLPQGAVFGDGFERMGLDNERARMRVEEAGVNLKPADENIDQNQMTAADVWNNSMNATQNSVDVSQNVVANGRDLGAIGNMVLSSEQSNQAVTTDETIERGLYGMPEAPQMGEIVDVNSNLEARDQTAIPYNTSAIRTDGKGLNQAAVAEIDRIRKSDDPAAINDTIRGEGGMVAANLKQSYGREYGGK